MAKREGWYKPTRARVAHRFEKGRWFANLVVWHKSFCGQWAIGWRGDLVSGTAAIHKQGHKLCKACLRKEARLFAQSPEGRKQAEFMAGSETETGGET